MTNWDLFDLIFGIAFAIIIAIAMTALCVGIWAVVTVVSWLVAA